MRQNVAMCGNGLKGIGLEKKVLQSTDKRKAKTVLTCLHPWTAVVALIMLKTVPNSKQSNRIHVISTNPVGATMKLACRDMQQFEFLSLSRMSLKLHTYEVFTTLAR